MKNRLIELLLQEKMKKIKSGKEEIVYLLTKVIEKYKQDTGAEVVQNTNRKNYESLAIFLSEISNQLPEKFAEWGTESYTPEAGNSTLQYPYKKYDITGGQIKDAVSGVVNNPRPFLVDACYVYLYGKGRKGFEESPADDNLLEENGAIKNISDTTEVAINKTATAINVGKLERNIRKKNGQLIFTVLLALIFIATAVYFFLQNKKTNEALVTLKTDMSLLPYKPTQAEIDSLEGIWLCYTGSPQARFSNNDRYHKVVSNLVEIKYKDGYFIFNRYGANFDHIGYIQLESPGIISMHSRIKNNTGIIESPRHSLMKLGNYGDYIPAMSASWNFDTGNNNKIVGIREVYKKIGKGGTIQEVMNEVENAGCQCKIIKWIKPDNSMQVFQLKNIQLETIDSKKVQQLINEKSILLNEPDSSIILAAPKQ